MSILMRVCLFSLVLGVLTCVGFAREPRSDVVTQSGVAWHTTSGGASSAAAGTSRTGDEKPIVLFRHVGELSGPMCSASHAMRMGSYAHPEVQAMIRAKFVPLSQNMETLAGAGSSVGHLPSDAPGFCTNRIAHQNCQALFLTPKGEFFHVATGYLSPQDLLVEMQFASGLFAEMQKRPKEARELVATAHLNRLKQLGFTESDLKKPADPLNMRLQESGIPPIGEGALGGDLFKEMARQRILVDHRYLIEHPLISHAEFERDPSPLVGKADLVFQSGNASGRNTGKLGTGKQP